MSDERKDFEILDKFGVKPQEGGLVERTVNELGGEISSVKRADGTVIQRTPTGFTDGKTHVENGLNGIEEIGQDGTHYDKDGNVTLEGEPKEE